MATNKRLIKSNDEAAGGASFNTVLYDGNGTTQSIGTVGFAPDLVWIKCRNIGFNHNLYFDNGGTIERLRSNTTGISDTNGNLSSFDSNGFTFTGSNSNTNASGSNYVAWCWKAGGAAVTNTDGTITSQVSANTEAGFSIVSYTGNGANGTVGHGLGVTPNIVLTKRRNSTSNWSFNGNFGGLIYGTNKLALNDTAGIAADTNEVLAANSNNFTAGTSGAVGASGGTYIAYCFAEVAGFSKFGSYVGGTGNVTVNDLGFKPLFVMIKNASTSNENSHWVIFDTIRSGGDLADKTLYADSSDAEATVGTAYITMNDNGFIVNNSTSFSTNNPGDTYIYMAFANQF